MNLWASVSVQNSGPWCVCALIIAILQKLTDKRSETMLETEQALVSNNSPVRDYAAGDGMSEAVNYATTHFLNTIPDRKTSKYSCAWSSIQTFLITKG